MCGINTQFMPMIEFIGLLNTIKPAQQSSDDHQGGILVIIRSGVILKCAHRINGIDILLQRPEEGVVNNPLPRLVCQGFRIISI